MSDHGDLALACVSLLVDELARGGVRHACLTPGSRSTPLALALERHAAIEVHVHVDERASSYFALGVARATGEPVIAACSSGTAAANHLPAVVEASMSRVPLIVLTADRPPELHDTGANQTIDQTRLFGAFSRWFVDAGVPTLMDDTARYWRSLGARAAAAAAGQPRGPVHINLPFREPLVPADEPVALGDAEAGRPRGAPWQRVVAPPRRPDKEDLRRLVDLLSATARVAVVAGSLRTAPYRLASLCADLGWALLAEPTSNVRRPGLALTAAELLAADVEYRETHRPEVVLQIGAAPTTRAMQGFVASGSHLVVIDPDELNPDPGRRAELTLQCDPDAVAAAMGAAGLRPLDDRWRRGWEVEDYAVRQAVDELLDGWDEPFEGRIARDVVGAAPDASVLFAGSSMPVRDLATYMAPQKSLRVLANRGASGIDGGVASALGIAAVAQPAFALIGDLALLHDASSLLWSAGRGLNLVLVVIDNDGGGIFTLLPQASLEPAEFERLFVAPHGGRLDLAALAQAAGAGYHRVETASAVGPAVAAASGAGGVHLVHVLVDRDRAPALRAAVSERVRAALAGVSAPRAREVSPRT
jgi:2-succinyl-5-enolpyruvyl-6-hydroxy-3-cyclohexene-1-carboxylate synthase